MADEHKTDLKGRLTAALPDGFFRRSIASPGRDSMPKDTLSPAAQPRTASPGRTLPRGFGGTVGKKDLEKMSAQERQRQEVIFEIIDTERQYVNDLKLLVEKLLHPAIEKGVLTKEDAGHLCLNVERLLELNADLLKDLDALQAKDIIIPGIGPTLLTRCDHLKLYAVYCAHYKQATYEEMRARLPKFGAFVDEVLKGDEWRGVPLTAYLHKPIARICKYPLLLRELLKQTPESLADHAPLAEAHSRICAVVDRINERTRQVEAMQRLDDIEKSLDGAKDIMLAQLTRRFLREVNCKETAKKDDVHLFLFNDLLILARPRSKKGRYDLKRHSPLHLMTCSDVAGDAKALELVWQDGAHDVVEFATTEEYSAWRTELMNLITSCKEELKKRPAPVPLAVNTNDRASGRGKLTRATSDGHLKNQALLKSSGEMKEAAKIGAAESAPPVQASPKDRKVPVLMVGTPMLVASEPSPKHTDGTTPGRARHLIDLEKLAGRSAESPRSARRSTIAESPRKGKDYAAMSKEELLKEVHALHTDKEMMQASLAQLKGDMARVAVGLRDEVTSLRERLAAAERERDEARAALAASRK